MSTFQNKPASNKETCQRSRTHKQHGTEKKNTGGNKSFSPSPKATTTNRTLTEIADCCKVSIATVHRTITAKDKVPGNTRHLCGRKRKLIPEHEALVLGSIAELRERENSYFAASDGEGRNRPCH